MSDIPFPSGDLIMDETSDLRARAYAMIREGGDLESAIDLLRKSGCSKIDCVRVLRQEGGIGLDRAKDIVHLSKAWQDVWARDEALHDRLAEVMPQPAGGRARKRDGR